VPATPSTHKPPSKRAIHLYTTSYLIFFSILGTLARLGLQSLTFYPGTPLTTSVLWANFTGSLIMGFLSEDKNLFREEWGHPHTPHPGESAEHAKKHKAVKKTIPLYVGLTTGFCGSLTSFSSFIRDVFLALANALPDPSLPDGYSIASRNGGYSFMALVAVIAVTVSMSLSGLVFGAHVALALGRFTPTVPFALTRRVLDRGVVVLAWGCWLGAVFLAIWPPDRDEARETWRGRAVFALVFAPLGCLVRFYVSLALNSRIPSFPLGTFVVNIFGTAVEGMCYDLQHVSGLGTGASALVGCQVLQGVMDGFCGCTTTISTWVSELNGLLNRRHAYVYGASSVGVGLGILVVIMGSLLWTRGFDEPVCG
jgi:fluoride ion exporter CrcB/FEX